MTPFTSGVQTADFQNLIRRQFRTTMFFSMRLLASACCFALLIVFQLGAEMKMERVTTSPNVAVMEHLQSYRNWSIIKFPRNSMSSFAGFSVPHVPVSILIERTTPQPAPVVYQHAGLESFFQSFAWRFGNLWHQSSERISIATTSGAKTVVVWTSSKSQMTQTDASYVVAKVTDAQSFWHWTIEVEPMPFSGMEIIPVLSEHGASTISCASSPLLARSQCRVVGGHWTVAINVLEEPKDGVYELGRHNESQSFCLAATVRESPPNLRCDNTETV